MPLTSLGRRMGEARYHQVGGGHEECWLRLDRRYGCSHNRKKPISSVGPFPRTSFTSTQYILIKLDLVHPAAENIVKTTDRGSARQVVSKHMQLADAVNVSVPEEMDGKLTKSIIEEYGLKSSASMVRTAKL